MLAWFRWKESLIRNQEVLGSTPTASFPTTVSNDPAAPLYDIDYAALRHAAGSRPEWLRYIDPSAAVGVAAG